MTFRASSSSELNLVVQTEFRASVRWEIISNNMYFLDVVKLEMELNMLE